MKTIQLTTSLALLSMSLYTVSAIAEESNLTQSLTTNTAASQPERLSDEQESEKLFALVNQYRQQKQLTQVPMSKSLTKVAEAHVQDLEKAYIAENANQCNLHSWSNSSDWSPCCYSPDHAQAQCMWNKPNQISKGVYTSHGYEIAVYHSESMNAERALELWKTSKSHHDMILNKDAWTSDWNAMGAAVSGKYAAVWFGHDKDTSK